MGSFGFIVWGGFVVLDSVFGVGSSWFRVQVQGFQYQGEGVREEVLVLRVLV